MSIIDIKNLDYDQLTSVIYDCWENRDIIKKELEVKIPLVKENASFSGMLVKELLNNNL